MFALFVDAPEQINVLTCVYNFLKLSKWTHEQGKEVCDWQRVICRLSASTQRGDLVAQKCASCVYSTHTLSCINISCRLLHFIVALMLMTMSQKNFFSNVFYILTILFQVKCLGSVKKSWFKFLLLHWRCPVGAFKRHHFQRWLHTWFYLILMVCLHVIL